jgi:cyclic-di-GMP-binding protein
MDTLCKNGRSPVARLSSWLEAVRLETCTRRSHRTTRASDCQMAQAVVEWGRVEVGVADQFAFDVVSEVNMQELKNALDQATKEVKQRFDFKDSKTDISLKEKEKELVVVSDDEYKLKAVQDIIKTKCVKRGVSLKAFNYGAFEPALSGTVRQVAKIQSGLASEKAKEISKAIKDSKLKVQAQIQGEQVRVSSKSKDELQSAIGFLRGKDFGIDLQFTNYR